MSSSPFVVLPAAAALLYWLVGYQDVPCQEKAALNDTEMAKQGQMPPPQDNTVFKTNYVRALVNANRRPGKSDKAVLVNQVMPEMRKYRMPTDVPARQRFRDTQTKAQAKWAITNFNFSA